MASVASVYARAFADVVQQKRVEPSRALGELQMVSALLRGNADLRRVWENPSIPADQKRRVLDALAGREGLSQTSRNFVAVIIDHRRTHLFDAIMQQVAKELDDRMGFAEAQISSARELSPNEKHALEAQVERLTGRKVRATYARDPALLGGAVVRVGSTIYDGSVLGQLSRIREQIASSAV